MMVSMKMAVFCVVLQCRVVEVTYILETLAASISKALIIALMMEATSTSEMSVNFHHTTWHNHPDHSYLQ
jgi:hypothetical protein